MNLECYEYQISSDFSSYTFTSEGPKGSIRKVVTFAKMNGRDDLYNLGFGDLDPVTGKISDLVETKNNDMNVILATVASTVVTFCNECGNHFIYASGSTPSRTRLYRICISKYFDDISQEFDVFGVIGSESAVFQHNVNYDGFLVKRKI